MKKQFVLCVPTLNPGDFAEAQAIAFLEQTWQPERILIIDSSSDDGSLEAYKKCNAQIVTINRSEFDHGGTRQKIFEIVPNAEIYLYLTQDAIPVDEWAFENLISAFNDDSVGAAYGRQLPHNDANEFGAHARLFNYSADDLVKSANDIPSLGIKTAFTSNSFAAYRRAALSEAGGFPYTVIFGEDTYVVARIILAGWKVAYCAKAQVYHSHNYSISEEFKRYFDIGVFHAKEPWLRESFGKAEGEGRRFVKSEIRYLWQHKKRFIPEAIVRTLAKYLGFRLGLHYSILPTNLARSLSMNRRFWSKI